MSCCPKSRGCWRPGSGTRVADTFAMVAKTFFGLEDVLADELRELGADDVQTGRRMVSFRGDQRLLYRANLECRTAVRILRPIAKFPVENAGALYRCMSRTNWLKYLEPEGTLAIDPVVHSRAFTNSLYAAQVAKDGIVDEIRRRTGVRPSVDLEDPDLRLNLHIDGQRATIYLDASGESLHKRGYRTAAGAAPINEVLAAGILRLSGWDRQSALVDFLCGSGTFPIEAAMLARRIAPGTIRHQFGYMRWKDFSQSTHDALVAEARARELPDLPFPIVGSDHDAELIALAGENAVRARVAGDVAFRVQDFAASEPPAPTGTVVINPPYEERLKTEEIIAFHRRIGDVLKRHFGGYTAFVLAGNLEAGKHVGLRPNAKIRLFNGPIECRLLKFVMYPLEGRSKEKTETQKGPQRHEGHEGG